MGKAGDNLGDDDVFDLGEKIEGLDPADFADDQSPTNPGATRLKFKPKAPGERNRRRKKARRAPPKSIVEDNRRAVDPERDEEVFFGESGDDLDGELSTSSTNHRVLIAKPSLNGSVIVRGEAENEAGGYIHAPEKGGRQDREAQAIIAAMFPDEEGIAAKVNEVLGGETSAGLDRLEKDLKSLPPLKMKYGPVSFWKRRTVQAIAALGLLGTVGIGSYKLWEYFQASPDETEDVAKLADPVAINTPTYAPVSVNEPTAKESTQAATLYDEVGDKLEVKTEGTDLSQGTKARIHAASTNDLTESLYEGAKQWETLDGQWLDTPEAHTNVVKKLTTWGGYKDVLTVSANANTIDEMLENIADSDLPHAEYVAWKVATQIASIKDAEVVPSVEEVETRLGTVDSAAIDQTLDENIENPPPIPGPSFFADQADQTGSLDSSLYDAPEPVSLLAKTVEMSTPEDMPDLTTDLEEETAPRFEDRFDAIEPSHVKPVVQAKTEVPVFMDPTEPAEPVNLLAKREAEIPDVTEFLEEEPVPPPAPKPVPTLLENAKSALSSLTQMLKIPKIPRLW